MTADSLKSSLPSRLTRSLIAIDLALAALYLLNFFVPGPSGTLIRLLDLDAEDGIGTWYSSVKHLGIAMLFGIFCYRNVSRREISSWVLLFFPALFAFFSLDEIVQIHEWLGRKTDVLLPAGDREGTLFHMTGIWMFALGIPTLAALIFFVRANRFYFQSSPGFITRFLIGFLVFLAGAGGIEILTNFASDLQSLAFRLEVYAEELLEMIGASLMFGACARLLQSNGFAIQLQPVRNGDDR